jgi:hypothetical protein
MFNKPDLPYLISTYPAVRQAIPLIVIGSVHLVSIILIWILTCLGDFIPSFTYYLRTYYLHVLSTLMDFAFDP